VLIISRSVGKLLVGEQTGVEASVDVVGREDPGDSEDCVPLKRYIWSQSLRRNWQVYPKRPMLFHRKSTLSIEDRRATIPRPGVVVR